MLLYCDGEDTVRPRRCLIHKCWGSTSCMRAYVKTVGHFCCRANCNFIQAKHRNRTILLLSDRNLFLLRDHLIEQALVQQINQLFIVNLQERALNEQLSLRSALLLLLKDEPDDSRYDSELLLLHTKGEAWSHRVRFARACLPIR